MKKMRKYIEKAVMASKKNTEDKLEYLKL